MYAYNFEYDGQLLSDFGFIVCNFDSTGGASTADAGSQITFDTAPAHSGKRYFATGTSYNKCLSTTIQICKDPDSYGVNEMEITAEEFRNLSRWLNRRQYLWFHAFDWCDPEVSRPWVRATFDLKRIDIGDVTMGVELSMSTDSPFGYADEVVKTFEFTSENLSQGFHDENDEIGDTYPELTVTCGASGTWTLADDVTGCRCEVLNCVSGEVLSFSGETMMVETSSVTHERTLGDDFNYDFFRFGNTFGNRENVITSTMPCTVELRYRPILKDTI